MNLPASLDSSIEMPLREDSLSSSLKMDSFRFWVRVLHPLMILAITGCTRDFLQSTDCMMIGRKEVSIEASLHLNFGSKVESQGYPRIRSSPRSVTKNFMISCLSLV